MEKNVQDEKTRFAETPVFAEDYAANRLISRRKLLASLGMAGVAAAAGMLMNGGSALAQGNPGAGDGKGKDGDRGGGAHGNRQADGMRLTTIAQLRSMTIPDASSVYYVTDRGQEGEFYYDPADAASVDNTGLVLVGTGGARFKRIYAGPVNVKWFGAKGDNVHDDTTAVQAALDASMSIFFPDGLYKISKTLKASVSYGSITGSNAWICPDKSIPAWNLFGYKMIYRGVHISYANVPHENINENAVAIWLHMTGTSEQYQVNNSLLSDFFIYFAHTGIKSTPNTGLIWQNELARIMMVLYPGVSAVKSIGIDLESSMRNEYSSTTLKISKVSIGHYSERPLGVGLRGMRIVNVTDIELSGCNTDSIFSKQSNDPATLGKEGGEVLEIVNPLKLNIVSHYFEGNINQLNLTYGSRSPILIASPAADVSIDNIFVSYPTTYTPGGIGTLFTFRGDPVVKFGSVYLYNPQVGAGSAAKIIDFSEFRGKFFSTANLKRDDFAYFERNSANTRLAVDEVAEYNTAAVPAASSVIFKELLPAKAYLLLVKAFYKTDSRISFTDLVLMNASQYNVNREVTLVSSNKVEYPFDNGYSLTSAGELKLQRSGGGEMDVFVKIVMEL